MSKRVLLPAATALAFLAAAAPGAADTRTNISGSFTYEDCGPGHAITVPEKSTIQLSLSLSETTVAIEVELRGPFGDVTRSDGTPNSGSWRRDVFTAGTYNLRICGKQRAQDDAPVSYVGTVTTSPTSETPPQGNAPKVIHSVQDTRATMRREAAGSGAVATRSGVATFRVRTVDGAVKLTYHDARAGIHITPQTRVRALFGANSVTVIAGRTRVMLIDRGSRLDRLVAKKGCYRVAGNLVRGGVTVL
jgi:hypothetical protein